MTLASNKHIKNENLIKKKKQNVLKKQFCHSKLGRLLLKANYIRSLKLSDIFNTPIKLFDSRREPVIIHVKLVLIWNLIYLIFIIKTKTKLHIYYDFHDHNNSTGYLFSVRIYIYKYFVLYNTIYSFAIIIFIQSTQFVEKINWRCLKPPFNLVQFVVRLYGIKLQSKSVC